MQEVIENVECDITISDEECIEEDDNDNVEMLAKECAYRNSQAFLKKYSGKNISLLSKKLKRRLKKHRKNVRTYERIHLNMIKDMQCDAEALTGATTATKRAQRNDHIPSAPIKRRRLSSLSCHQDLQVAIIDKSDPHGRLDDDMWLKLEEKLIAELISSRWCNEEIAFDGANWSRGVKIVKCGNTKTLDFLKETITNVCANWPHIHLEIINRSALPLRIFARMWIPQPVPSNDTILTLIQKQNDGISTENWRIINSKPSKKNPGKDYRMFIDGNSAKAILQCNGRIHFGLNFIRIHVGNVN